MEAQIERYLLGEMEREELKTFQQRINQDLDLQQEVQAYSRLYEQLDNLRLQEKVKRAIADNGINNKKFFNIPLSVWLVAATLLLGTGAFMYKLFLTPQEPKIVLIKPDTDSLWGNIPNDEAIAYRILIADTDSLWGQYGNIHLIENLPINSDTADGFTNILPNPKEPQRQSPTKPTLPLQKNNPPAQTATTTPSKPIIQPDEPQLIAGNAPKITTDPKADNTATYSRAGGMDTANFLDKYYLLPKQIAKLDKWKAEYNEYVKLHRTTIDLTNVHNLLEQLYNESNGIIERLTKLNTQDAGNLAIKYYIAHAYLIKGNTKGAIPHLETIVNKKNTYSFTKYAQYFLALCYIMEQKDEEAKVLLCKLHNNENIPRPITKVLSQILADKFNDTNCN